MQANIYQQYKSQSLETLTKGEIVIKLFDEAAKQVNTAILLLDRGEGVAAYNCISKARKVVDTLRTSLDMRMALSIQLSELYQFIYAKLGEGIANGDKKLLKELSGLLEEFRVTFKRADIVARTNSLNGSQK